MSQTLQPGAQPSAVNPLSAMALLWLAGCALRLTILAVPPVIPLIHDDLSLSETQVGILSGLPMAMFAGAAIAGSLLIARFGARMALIAGLLACGLGSALRSVGPNLAMLYVGTVATAFGVAVMQPSLPPLVRAWVPQRIGVATAVYTNGLLIGELLPVATTIPLLLPLIGGSWRLSFVCWGALALLIAAVIAVAAPPYAATQAATNRRWWPDFRNPLIWRIGILLGSVNSMYFSLNGFLPDYLTHTGRPDLIHGALTALNGFQLPASFLLLMTADWLVRSVWSYVFFGAACLAGILMLLLPGSVWPIAGIAFVGFAAAGVLILVLALPPLISPPEDVHRVSAGMFTISYSCAVIIPIISGALWDLTGLPAVALIPMALCALAVIGLAPLIVLRENRAVA
jgi:CP family cyanate transporter-like MFS transporter